MTQTPQNKILLSVKAPELARIEQASQKVVRPMLSLSICTMIFGLILFAGIGQAGHAIAAASSGESPNTACLTANEPSPIILVSSPKNITYTISDVPLTFTVYGNVSWIGYSLDGQANVTITGNWTLTILAEGSHYVVVYSNSTAGNMHSSQTVYFSTTHVSVLEVVTLGLIQGFAEWLPISSTAHLKIAEQFLNLTRTALLDVVLHVGTLVVVVFVFRKEVKEILKALVHRDFQSEYGQLIPLIIFATIPTGIVGLLYKQLLENTFQTFLIIGITFLVGATILYTSRVEKENTDKITVTIAIIMGAAQGFAIFPGLSRSGITISTALLLGLRREKAFKFSFLLSIPAIVGDLVVTAYKQGGQLAAQTIGPLEILVGMVIAMIAGYIAIRIVSNLVRSKRFHYFAIYTALLGITLIALSLSGYLTT